MPTHGSRSQQHKDDQAGIQMLMAAEQEAQQIINSARNSRASRLRQAKNEGEREVSQYRATREAEFRRKLSQASGDAGQLAKRLEQETLARLQKVNAAANQAGAKVIELLVKWAITCKNENILPQKAGIFRKPDEKIKSETGSSASANALNLL